MKIYVLSENTAASEKFASEHGLSLYIETKKHKILFDMGQSEIFAENARLLGVDLSKVDIAFLSHGHYDHGGGMARFFELNKTAPVYLNPSAFGEHFAEPERYIGLDKNLRKSVRLIFTEDIKIDNELSVVTLSDKAPVFEIDPFGLNMVENGHFMPEDFRHELYLVIKEDGKTVVISGCSHKGILNITHYLSPDILIGGFHFSKIPADTTGKQRLKYAADTLLSSGAVFYTCHCTGKEQFSCMKEIMKDSLHYLRAGDVIAI